MIPAPNNISQFVGAAGRVVAPWLQFLQQFAQAPPKVTKITLPYTAKEPGIVMLDGGATSVQFTRGTTTINLGAISLVPVAIKDIVSADGARTVYFVPSFGQNTNV